MSALPARMSLVRARKAPNAQSFRWRSFHESFHGIVAVPGDSVTDRTGGAQPPVSDRPTVDLRVDSLVVVVRSTVSQCRIKDIVLVHAYAQASMFIRCRWASGGQPSVSGAAAATSSAALALRRRLDPAAEVAPPPARSQHLA
jgi:hypothetical protein